MIPDALRKKLVRETQWSRTYEVEPGYYAFESKFEADGLSVDISQLATWDSWDDSNRLDFAKAFQLKVPITPQDEGVLEFLMAHGNDYVLNTIAGCLTRHSDRDMVLSFLLARLSAGAGPKGNFVQALGELGDPRAAEPIKSLHKQLINNIRSAGTKADRQLVSDFFASCAALNKLEHTASYSRDVEPFLNDPDEVIRAMAKLSLEGG